MTKKLSAKSKNVIRLIVSVVACEMVGIVGSVFTASSVSSWYAGIVKPSFNPPSWVFAPVWTALFFIMGVAAFLVWKKGLRKKAVRIALTVFGIHLILNLAWSALFFGLRFPAWAFAEIVVLWISILVSGILFYKVSKPATWLLLPYLLWVGFAGYLNFSIWTLNIGQPVSDIGCTLEARICPDGSSVGRSGPDCKFEECPESKDTGVWRTYTDNSLGISFGYPEDLLTDYIHEVDWPPQIILINEPFSCSPAGYETDRAGATSMLSIDGRRYCVTKVSEGAAGSVYAQYAYAVPRGEKTVIFTFSLRAVQCGNYDSRERTICENEWRIFDINGIVDRIAVSLKGI